MDIKSGAILAGLNPVMRAVLREADRIWQDHGKELMVTEGLGGTHSAPSWHYYGLALDLRTKYFSLEVSKTVHRELKAALPEYDIVHHIKKDNNGVEYSSHIHAEIGNTLAKQIGVYY